ncbi:MAG: MFS transporter [Candidatus Thorarchaeota archaeon]|nr:MAG: MFS transporter [Candidatus Thorarchaeota archaeon]
MNEDKSEDTAAEDAVPSLNQDIDESWTMSVRHLMANRNFKVFVVTNWIAGSLNVLWHIMNLYLRDIGINYVLLGFLFSAMALVTLIGTLVASYLADNYNRRNLAIITMAINGIAMFILSLAASYEIVALGLITLALSNFTGQGGTAYIYQIIDRKYGGVAISLFTMGALFGLGPLFAMAILFNIGWTFILIMRAVFFIGAILCGITVVIRILWLESTPIPERERNTSVIRDFISESYRGLKLLVRVFPILVGVMMIDALSDNLYGFSNLFYINETLEFNIGQIFLMILITLAISVPLTLLLGQRFDKRGGKRITIAVYSVMPIALTLLIVAQYVPFIAPPEWVDFLDIVYPGLGVILSLAFIATAIKTTNDNLWGTVMGAYIQKSLPKADLGKMLGVSALLVLLVGTITPIFSGYIYTLFEGVPLIIGAIILNIVILVILVTKSIEPRVDVLELEAELKSKHGIRLEE